METHTLPASVLLSAALLLGSVLIGCGGSSNDDAAPATTADAGSDRGGDTTLPAGADDEAPEPETSDGGSAAGSGRECSVTGPVRGDAIVNFVGDPGTVSTENAGGGPPAFYSFAKDDTSLSLYAAGDGFDASIVLSIDGVTYGSDAAHGGVEVAADGSGGTVSGEYVTAGTGDGSVTTDLQVVCDPA